MPRRSKSAIHSLYASRKSRPTSTADGPGYLYAFSDTGHKWKVVGDGRILSRFRDGDEQNHWLIFSSNSSAMTGRVTIALIVRSPFSLHSARQYLLRGRKIHCEVFTFTTNRTFTWKNIIRPLLFEAAKA
ncbi:hypothetical protein C8R42DRAFT_720767 [Lentinula raphanica]|nr:hypothetical protein C8R42DRAFT_720767 [Lentinula raphanica]